MDKAQGKNIQMSAAMTSLMAELRVAQKAGNTVKVAALREQVKTQREADQKTHQSAMDNAIASGYEAWKTFAKKQGMPDEMIAKITSSNFSTFVELHNTMKKAMELQQTLGLSGSGMGMRMGGGMPHMGGR